MSVSTRNTCYCCGQEVNQTECPKCLSGHTRIGVVEFVWNGFVAKRAEVAWCAACDFVWIIGADGNHHPLCRDCRKRHLEFQFSESCESENCEPEPATAHVAAA